MVDRSYQLASTIGYMYIHIYIHMNTYIHEFDRSLIVHSKNSSIDSSWQHIIYHFGNMRRKEADIPNQNTLGTGVYFPDT